MSIFGEWEPTVKMDFMDPEKEPECMTLPLEDNNKEKQQQGPEK